MVVLVVLVVLALSVMDEVEENLVFSLGLVELIERGGRLRGPGLVGLAGRLDVPAMSYKVDRSEGRQVITRSGMVHIFCQFAGNLWLHRSQGVISFIYRKLLNHKDDLDEDQSEMRHSGIIAPMQALDQLRPVAQGGARYQPARMS